MTPYVSNLSNLPTPGRTQAATTASCLQSDYLELSNTTGVFAATQHQVNWSLHPEDWLQSVNRSSFYLTNPQILQELPHFPATNKMVILIIEKPVPTLVAHMLSEFKKLK